MLDLAAPTGCLFIPSREILDSVDTHPPARASATISINRMAQATILSENLDVRFNDVVSGAKLLIHALLCDAPGSCGNPVCNQDVANLKSMLGHLEVHVRVAPRACPLSS